MAIKIQGSVIIDDSKNIQDNTGFLSDANNSALRPRSSNGGSYFQRWTGSTWETILYGANDGINCYRNVSVAAPYRFIGDGSGLTNLPIPTLTFPYNYYYDATNTAVRANGTTFIQNGAGTDSFAYFNNGGIGLQRNTTVSGQATITGNAIIGESSAITMGYAGHSFIEVRRGSYPYIDFGAESYSDYAGRVAATSGGELVLDPRVNLQITNVPEGAVTADPNLKITAGGRIRRLTSTRRIKENIQYSDFDHISDKIYDLKTAYFTYTEAEDSSALDMGLIAEDVNELIPELAIIDYFRDQYEEVIVPERGNSIEKKLKENAVKTPVSVNYDRLPIIMIGTLKKLRQRVIDLEEEMQSLKASLQTP